jgi:hypothetical protein
MSKIEHTFYAKDLTIKLSVEGKNNGEVKKIFKSLVNQITLSMQDVMDRVAKERILGKSQEQGEWKERLAKYLKGTEYALWYGNEWDLSDEVEEFISQLLSEKTFNKEELKYLKACTGIVYDEWKIDGKKIDTTMVERLRLKISKLLKE